MLLTARSAGCPDLAAASTSSVVYEQRSISVKHKFR